LVSASWVMSAQCRFFTPRQGQDCNIPIEIGSIPGPG
jgi:hypothetical protein